MYLLEDQVPTPVDFSTTNDDRTRLWLLQYITIFHHIIGIMLQVRNGKYDLPASLPPVFFLLL